MPLDFEQTPLHQGETVRNITPDALNGEVAIDLHQSTLEGGYDLELSQDRDAARAKLDSIFNNSEGQVAERMANQEHEQRRTLPIVLDAYRENAERTSYVNPDVWDKAA